jgi:tRNA 2-thiouridine synthesizing protein A
MARQAINNASDRGAAPHCVDARGCACPIPALRLARAVREKGAGWYLLLAEDPAAAADIPALVAERGWALHEAGAARFLVEVPPLPLSR